MPASPARLLPPCCCCRGNCSLASYLTYDRFRKDNDCVPNIRNWNEPYKVYMALKETRQLNLSAYECEGPPAAGGGPVSSTLK